MFTNHIEECDRYYTRAAIQLTSPVTASLSRGSGAAFKTIIDPLNVIQKSILKATLNKIKIYSSYQLFIESDNVIQMTVNQKNAYYMANSLALASSDKEPVGRISRSFETTHYNLAADDWL
ncbi:hypothetical protein J6590_030672 [Homalodisca vitripennis]|nr:hypothetical protein J6590_030672 [Homalodisca vitripennis]